jgi:hypothetical protein
MTLSDDFPMAIDTIPSLVQPSLPTQVFNPDLIFAQFEQAGDSTELQNLRDQILQLAKHYLTRSGRQDKIKNICLSFE